MSGRNVITVALVFVVAMTLITGATAGSEATAAGSAYKLVGRWGTAGTGNGQFGGNAFGLATDRNGTVFVADSDNRRIQIFSSQGAFQGKITFDPESFVEDVAIDPEGNVWGTEGTAFRAQRFTRDGQPLTSVDTPKVARGIAVDAEGNVYVVTAGDEIQGEVVRFDKAGSSWQAATTWGGFEDPHDIEVSPDGSIYVSDWGALDVKRFGSDGKLLNTIRGGGSNPLGIGVDLDCNLWVTNIAQRRLDRFSPSGRLLATAASPDLIAQDVAIGPTGDVYAFDSGTKSVVRFAEDRSKPATASIPGRLTVSKGPVVRIPYTLSGVACPAEVGATASLKGKGISGTASGLKLRAGARSVIEIKLSKGALRSAAASGKATFRIVLRTNGRPTTETRSVTVVVPAGVR